MMKAFKAGLLAITALATIVPAVAQDQGPRGWGAQRGGGDRGGGNRGGGDRGGAQRGGGNDGGGFNRAPARMESPAPAPTNRQWQGNQGDRPTNGGGAQWRGDGGQSAPRPVAPVVNTDNRQSRGANESRTDWRSPRPGNGGTTTPAYRPGLTGQNGRDWNREADRRGNDWRNNDDRRGNDGRWDGRGNDGRGNDGRWNDRNNGRNDSGWQNRGRLSANDRWRDQQRWNNDWRRDSRYDWTSYRRYNRDIYRLPAYRAPYGWSYGYRSFSIGLYLGSSLYGNDYWIDDPWTYRLPAAYGSMRWIRYYDDALLVDVRDGYVVDVIRNFFW